MTWELHHKTKLMMVPVTVWISIDGVNVANLKLLLVHMDLDVLTILFSIMMNIEAKKALS